VPLSRSLLFFRFPRRSREQSPENGLRGFPVQTPGFREGIRNVSENSRYRWLIAPRWRAGSPAFPILTLAGSSRTLRHVGRFLSHEIRAITPSRDPRTMSPAMGRYDRRCEAAILRALPASRSQSFCDVIPGARTVRCGVRWRPNVHRLRVSPRWVDGRCVPVVVAAPPVAPHPVVWRRGIGGFAPILFLRLRHTPNTGQGLSLVPQLHSCGVRPAESLNALGWSGACFPKPEATMNSTAMSGSHDGDEVKTPGEVQVSCRLSLHALP